MRIIIIIHGFGKQLNNLVKTRDRGCERVLFSPKLILFFIFALIKCYTQIKYLTHLSYDIYILMCINFRKRISLHVDENGKLPVPQHNRKTRHYTRS